MARYVIIPNDLAHELHEPLRRHYQDQPSVHVIVERRRPGDQSGGSAGAGRRTADRGPAGRSRHVVVSTAPGSLPPEAVPHARRLRFLRTVESDSPEIADRESLRLVARFQQGDRDAFEALYRRHFDDVYGYLRISLGSVHQAEDVAQQVFIRALQALPQYKFRPNVPFWPWLREIARNEVRRALRPRGVSVESRDPTELDVAGDSLSGWQSERRLIALSEHLPHREQQVFMLRYGVGLSIAETGSVIGASEDAVKSLAKRALARVRQEMRDSGDAPPHRLPMRRRLRPSPVVGSRRAALQPVGGRSRAVAVH
jgi:RNA polymerase sigma-70 factor, ECF subfamily